MRGTAGRRPIGARENSRKKSAQGLTNEGSRGRGRKARAWTPRGRRTAAVDGGSIGSEGKDVKGRRSPRVRTACVRESGARGAGAGRHFSEAEPRPGKQRLRKTCRNSQPIGTRDSWAFLSSPLSEKTDESHLTVCPFTGEINGEIRAAGRAAWIVTRRTRERSFGFGKKNTPAPTRRAPLERPHVLSDANESDSIIPQHTHIHHAGNAIQIPLATHTTATYAADVPRWYPLSA